MNDKTTWNGRFRMYSAAGVAMVWLATGCASDPSSGGATAREQAPSEVRGTATSVQLERALRDVDRGANLAAAGESLRRLAADQAATADERDQARLGLSRALELLGEKEGAIGALEGLLASHTVDQRFAARPEAEKRLRRLLTGSDEEAPWLPDEEPVAPVAKALAAYFPPAADGATRIELLAFGGTSDRSEHLGTFNIAGALRELKKQACPLCAEDLRVRTSRSRNSSWVAIPMTMAGSVEGNPRWETALAVFYYDLGPDHIPARYDQYLPMSGARADEVLEQGKGLIAVRQRDGAPPVVMLAAPRWGQLDKVEEAFSRMTRLPSEPAVVELDAGLAPAEIQAVTRASRKAMRACYEELLSRKAGASGKVVFAYTIEGDGTVSNASLDEGTTLSDVDFGACMLRVAQGLQFPATGRKTTVKYPIAVSPEP